MFSSFRCNSIGEGCRRKGETPTDLPQRRRQETRNIPKPKQDKRSHIQQSEYSR